MVREETLRALISARETLSKSMRDAAEGTRDLRNAMAQTISSSSGLVGAMDVSENSTNEYKRAVRGLGRESVKATAKQEFLAQGVEHAGGKATMAASQVQRYARTVDRSGDEATEATVKNFGLASSFQTVAAAAGAASVNVGPFNTNVRAAVIALPALIALVGATATALVGLATAAAAATGALLMLFTGGILGQAEELARHSSEIEGRMEALEEIFSRVGDALEQALEPVQTLTDQAAAMSVLGGIVTIIGDLAESAARLRDVFGGMAERLDAVFWAEEARGIAELEQMISEMAPILENLAFYVLANLPDLIGWLRREAIKVIPVLADFTNASIALARELIEIGGTLLSVTLPALSIFIDAGAMILDVFTQIPDALYAAALAFGVTAGALLLYSGSATVAAAATFLLDLALAPIIAAVTALGSAVSATTLAIAAIVAVLVGAITYFGWWDDIIGGLVSLWNMLVESVEWLVNGFIWLSNVLNDALGPLLMWIPGIGQVMWMVANWDEIMRALGETIAWLGDMWEGFVDTVMRWVEPLLNALDMVHQSVDQAGGVELDGAKLEQPSQQTSGQGPSRGQAQQNADRGAGAGVQQRTQQVRENRQQNNFDFSGANFGSDTTEAQVQRAVERALERQNSTSSDT